MTTLAQTPSPVQDFDLRDLICGKSDCHDPGDYAFEHYHCSGCDGRIFLQAPDGDLPADATYCTCGLPYHRGCECWAHDQGKRVEPDPDNLLLTNVCRLSEDFGHCLKKLETTTDLVEAERLSYEAQRLVSLAERFNVKLGARIERASLVPLPLENVA